MMIAFAPRLPFSRRRRTVSVAAIFQMKRGQKTYGFSVNFLSFPRFLKALCGPNMSHFQEQSVSRPSHVKVAMGTVCIDIVDTNRHMACHDKE